MFTQFILFVFMSHLAPATPGSSAQITGEKRFVNFERKIRTGLGGELTINYQYFGEPVSSPANLELSITCSEAGKPTEIGSIAMCSIDKYQYEQDLKLLIVEFTVSRVDAGGKVHCDQKDEKKFNLRQLCRDRSREQKKSATKASARKALLR